MNSDYKFPRFSALQRLLLSEGQNAENVLILQNADLAKIYAANWEEHLRHTDPAQ